MPGAETNTVAPRLGLAAGLPRCYAGRMVEFSLEPQIGGRIPRQRGGGQRPDFSLEAQAGGRVAGVDEAGRGPLAGPVVAGAVVFPRGVPPALAALLDDSKKLSATRRAAAFAALLASPDAEIGIGAASIAEIAALNILGASLLAMRRAVLRLPVAPALALIDGNRPPRLACPTQCVVGGDGKSLSIAAASILAKVVRDRAMARLAVRYPAYGWDGNAGYPTAAHRAALARLGPTRHHRPGFGPVPFFATRESNPVDAASAGSAG